MEDALLVGLVVLGLGPGLAGGLTARLVSRHLRRRVSVRSSADRRDLERRRYRVLERIGRLEET